MSLYRPHLGVSDLKEPVRPAGEAEKVAQDVRALIRLQAHGEDSDIVPDPLYLSSLGVLKAEIDIAINLLDAGYAGANEVYPQHLSPHIELLITFSACSDIDIIDGDIRAGVLLSDQLGILQRGHAADPRAIYVADCGISGADTLQESYGLGDLARARPDNLALGRAGGIEHPLHLQSGDDIPEPAKAVLLLPGSVKGLPSSGHDYGPHIDREVLDNLIQLDRLGGAGLHTPAAADACLGVYACRQRNGLWIGHIDGFSLADAKVVLIGHLHWTDVCAFVYAAFAEDRVHIACPVNSRYCEVAHAALHPQDLGIGVEGDIGMVEDLGHLGAQNADGAVVGGKDVCEQGHVTADGRPAFHQKHMKARIRQVQGGSDPGHASSYYHHILVNRYLLLL